MLLRNGQTSFVQLVRQRIFIDLFEKAMAKGVGDAECTTDNPF